MTLENGSSNEPLKPFFVLVAKCIDIQRTFQMVCQQAIKDKSVNVHNKSWNFIHFYTCKTKNKNKVNFMNITYYYALSNSTLYAGKFELVINIIYLKNTCYNIKYLRQGNLSKMCSSWSDGSRSSWNI